MDLNGKEALLNVHDRNPVVDSAAFVYKQTDLVKLNKPGIDSAAKYIHNRVISEEYTPHVWRTHPLHLCPPDDFSLADSRTRECLNWIFLISSLNFSFWSDREGRHDRYGVEWREGWGDERKKVWTGYWSLVAALNRALENGIPITDPSFYSSRIACPDSLIAEVFKPAGQSVESIPLLSERILVMREVGFILCNSFGGSFLGFLEEFQRRHDNKGTSLQLVQMVTNTFPSFRDEAFYEGHKVFFWKRAQILVAETWAAFYPNSDGTTARHPFFPAGVGQLTMFADYRVPQILHHLRILTYPPQLVQTLKSHAPHASGSREELSIRSASILAVEAIRETIQKHRVLEAEDEKRKRVLDEVNSVLIDFYLWDLAKSLEEGKRVIEGVETCKMMPAHRTRSIWY